MTFNQIALGLQIQSYGKEVTNFLTMVRSCGFGTFQLKFLLQMYQAKVSHDKRKLFCRLNIPDYTPETIHVFNKQKNKLTC